MEENSKRSHTKKIKRNLISRLKKLLSNSSKSASWEIVEHNRRKLRLRLPLTERYNPRKKLKVGNKRVMFVAPTRIDYYNKRNYDLTNKFLSEICDCINKGRRIFIDFHNTKLISAAAMLSFLAEVDVLIKKIKMVIVA